MKILLFICSFITLLTFSLFAQNPLVRIHNWKDSEVELVPFFEETATNYFFFAKSPLFNQIKSTRNPQLFIEMMHQDDQLLVVLAGFLCLRESFPDLALEQAMRLILNSKHPASLVYAPIYQYIQQQKNEPKFRAAFWLVVAERPENNSGLSLLLTIIPYDFLYNWYNASSSPPLSASREAYILDRLYGEHPKGAVVSSEMKNALEKMQYYPGMPRFVFALYTDVPSTVFTNCLQETIEDESLDISDIVVLVLNRRVYVQELLTKDGVKISQERRARIEKILKRAANPKTKIP